MTDATVRIRGGAGAYEAAAIAAVIDWIVAEETAARSVHPRRPEAPAWVRIGYPRVTARFNPPIVPDSGLNWPG